MLAIVLCNSVLESGLCNNKEQFLLQTYKRDTGEIIHDISASIFVNGKHWGGFRMGYKSI